MKYIEKFISNLIMMESLLLTAFFGSTSAQLHFIGPLLMFGITIGAPVLAAVYSIGDSD